MGKKLCEKLLQRKSLSDLRSRLFGYVLEKKRRENLHCGT